MKRRDFLKLSAALALTGAAAACGGPSASSAPAVAEMIAGAAGAELFALEPVTPYTDADLDYNDSGSRTSQPRAARAWDAAASAWRNLPAAATGPKAGAFPPAPARRKSPPGWRSWGCSFCNGQRRNQTMKKKIGNALALYFGQGKADRDTK